MWPPKDRAKGILGNRPGGAVTKAVPRGGLRLADRDTLAAWAWRLRQDLLRMAPKR